MVGMPKLTQNKDAHLLMCIEVQQCKKTITTFQEKKIEEISCSFLQGTSMRKYQFDISSAIGDYTLRRVSSRIYTNQKANTCQ